MVAQSILPFAKRVSVHPLPIHWSKKSVASTRIYEIEANACMCVRKKKIK